MGRGGAATRKGRGPVETLDPLSSQRRAPPLPMTQALRQKQPWTDGISRISGSMPQCRHRILDGELQTSEIEFNGVANGLGSA
jgi:hypothetical protein